MKSTAIKTDNLRPLLSIKADDSGNLPDKIEVLQTGMWDAPYHGMFMVTPEDLQQYIQNFNANVRPSSSTKGLPIDLDHDAGAAAGWMTALSALPNDQGGWSLWADVKWTDLGTEKLLGGQYAFFSPEFCPEGYIDPEGEDEPLDNVLIGGGLTNRPLFKELQPVMASDATRKSSGAKTQFNKMFIKSAKENNAVPTLDEVRIKELADLSEEDKQVLAANEKELSSDERGKFQSVLAANEDDTNTEENGNGEGENSTEENTEENGGGENQNNNTNTEDNTVAASEKGQVVISASELESLKAAAAQGVSANEKLVKKEAEDHINSKVYSASDGFKAPADLKAELVGLYVSANDKQKEALDKLFDGMAPIKSAGEMGAQGTGANEFSSGSAYQGLKEKAEAVVTASDGKTSFTEAMLQARRENPELASAYDAEYNAGKPQVASR